MAKIKNIIEIPISPFSINKAWRGRRYMTPDYKKWRLDMSYLMPKYDKIQGEVELDFKFYIKYYSTSDADNLVKTCLDSLVENHIMEDDCNVKKFTAEKFKVNRKEDEKIIVIIK